MKLALAEKFKQRVESRLPEWMIKVFNWIQNKGNLPLEIVQDTLSIMENHTTGKPITPITASIKDLLDDLDKTFADLIAPSYSYFTSPDLRKSLNKIGPLVLPSDTDWLMSRHIKPNVPLPSIVFLAHRDFDAFRGGETDRFLPKFFYANKLTSIPINCSKAEGVPYEIGWAYQLSEKSKRVGWLGFHVTILPETGKITVLKHLKQKSSVVPLSKKRKPSFKENHRVNSVFIPQKAMSYPVMVEDGAKERNESEDMYAVQVGEIIATSFNLWMGRLDNWRVAVTKSGKRMSFLINNSSAKDFFKDRNVLVRTPTGQKKKIIHLVSEHTRVTKTKTMTIKEHLRGERLFTWKDYKCSVLSPKFHKYNIDKFAGASMTEEDSADVKTIALTDAMERMVEIEDRQTAY